MSYRNLKSVDTSDLLNIQGLTTTTKPRGKEVDTHILCKKEIEKLKRELSTEKNNVKKLKASLSDAKQSYEDIKSSHAEALAESAKKNREEKDQLETQHAKVLISLRKKHEEEIQLLQTKHKTAIENEWTKAEEKFDKQLLEKTEQYEKIISSKEEQIESLKSKVAESLKINSFERHKQIDELMKELQHVSEEAAYLRGVVENFNNQKCQKCSFYENKCKEMALEMATRNQNFKALIEVCSKMETQLSQQDDLCMLLASLKKVS